MSPTFHANGKLCRNLPNYLRRYRKQSGLSQDEVAFLLGWKSGSQVSRYEQFTGQPGLDALLALETIFRVPIAEIFSGTSARIKKQVRARSALLGRRLADRRKDRLHVRKIQTLQAI